MKFRVIRSFKSGQSGAIAPLYAIALLALIAIAGIAFDYGRLMAMQSELQNAADQAALAAVTQLDGKTGAQARARDAARNYFANQTRVANDDEGRGVTIADSGFTFFSDGVAGTPATSDTDSHAVEVAVDTREVFYALTPVVDAISSGGITARARAMLRKAVCNLPPLMLCLGENGLMPPVDKGMSLKLRFKLAPGGFGYLNVDGFDVNDEMGLNRTYATCDRLDEVEVRTGMLGAQSDAMATRFDYYKNIKKIPCNAATGDFCPAQGVRKNAAIFNGLATTVSVSTNSPSLSFAQATQALAAQGVSTTCPASLKDVNMNGWTLFQNIPLLDPTAANFGMDACFAAGTCDYVGDGNWTADKMRYFARYLPDLNPADFATRYEVYLKELTEPSRWLDTEVVGFEVDTDGKNGVYTHEIKGFYCAYPQPLPPTTPVVPDPPQRDRRVLTVAIVDNCDQLSGTSTTPHIATWMDVFLLEPPLHSTEEFNAEVIGPALRPDNQNSFQYYSRDRAVLIR